MQKPREQRQQFGQRVDLCVELGKILAEYPPGENILFELLQNADDAGASKVVFVLDERNYAQQSFFQASAPFSPWLGTALLAYNNSIFRPEDFDAIQTIGQSSKKHAPGRTGKFGIGFNSVYHMTDVPSFVSNTSFCLLDPVALTGGLQGRLDPVSEAGDLPELRPFRNCLGCDLSRPFPGTLFRFPLRNADHHQMSPLVAGLFDRVVYNADRILHMFNSFREVAHRALLFLRNVAEVSFVHYDSAGREQKCFTVAVPEALRPALVASRAQVLCLEPGLPNTLSEVVVRMEVEVRAGAEVNRYNWLIVYGMAGINDTLQELMAVSASPTPPVGAVAVDLCNLRVPRGGFYCTLPLPIITGLLVQLNSVWELPANRRTIWFGNPSDNRTLWNMAMGVHVLAPLYVQLLSATIKAYVNGRIRNLEEEKVADGQVLGSHPLSLLWPTPDMSASPLLPTITSSIYRLAYASSEPLFPVFMPPHPFAQGSNSLFLPTHEVVPNQEPVLVLLARMFEVASKSDVVKWRPCRSLERRVCVTRCGCGKKYCVCPCACKLPAHIVSLPAPATKLLIEAFKDIRGPAPMFLTPRLLASALRSSDFFASVALDPAMDGELYKGKQVTALLDYLAPTPALALENLPGVPLALTISGAHYQFGDKEVPMAFCSSAEELEIINHSRSQVLHDCVRECHALLDVKTATALNLISVSPLTLGTTFLKNLLPKGWDKKDYVEWSPEEKAADPKTPSKDWLRAFWKYTSTKLARSQPAEAVATVIALGPWPLIPTINLRLYPVRSAGIIFPSEQKERDRQDLSALLSLVGCEVLPTVFADIGKSLASSMLQLTANGIVQALSNKGIRIDILTRQQATALLKHIASKANPLAELSPAMCKALSQLALFSPVGPDKPLVSLSNSPYSWPAISLDTPFLEQVPNYVLSRPTKFLAAPGPDLAQLYAHLQIQERSLVNLLLSSDQTLVQQVIEENKRAGDQINFVQMVLQEARSKRSYAAKLSEVKFVCQIVGQTCVMRAPCELMHIAPGPDREAVANLDSSLLLPEELAGLARDLYQLGVTKGLDDANTFMSCLRSLKVLENSKEKGSQRVYRARLWLVNQFYNKHELFLADIAVLKEVTEQPFVFGVDCPKLASAAEAVLMDPEGKEMQKHRLFRLGDCVSFEDVGVVGRQAPCLHPDFTPPNKAVQRYLLTISSSMLIAHLMDLCQDPCRPDLLQSFAETLIRLNALYDLKLKTRKEIDPTELNTLFNLPCIHTQTFSFLPPSAFALKGQHPIPSWPGGLVALSRVLQIPEKANKQHIVATLQRLCNDNGPDAMLFAVDLMPLLLTAPGPLPLLDQIFVPTRDNTLVRASEVLFGDDEMMSKNAVKVPLLHEEIQDGWKVARALNLRNISEVCEWKTDPSFVFTEVSNARAINSVLQNPEFGFAVVRVIKHGLIKNSQAVQPDLDLILKKLLTLRVTIVASIQARLYCGGVAVGKGLANIRAQLDRSRSMLRVLRANTPNAIRAVVAEQIGAYLDNPPLSHIAEMLDDGIESLQGFLDDVEVSQLNDVDQALLDKRKVQREEAEQKAKEAASKEEARQAASRAKHEEAVQMEDEVKVRIDEGSKEAKKPDEGSKRKRDYPIATGPWSYKREADAEFTDFDIDTSQLLSDNAFSENCLDLFVPVNGDWRSIFVFPATLTGYDDQGAITLRPPSVQPSAAEGSKDAPVVPRGPPGPPSLNDPRSAVDDLAPALSRTLNSVNKPVSAIPKDKPGQPEPPIADRGCQPVVAEDLVLLPGGPFRQFVPKSASAELREKMARFAPLHGAMLAELFKHVVELPVEAINLVWMDSLDGHWTIAFNSGGALYFNVSYYAAQLQTPLATSPKNLAMKWFLTLCHELAHNRVSLHNADFANELSAVYSFYFKNMATWLGMRL